MPTWVSDYVGRPYDRLTFNCWTLVRDVYRDVLGLDLGGFETVISNIAIIRTMMREQVLWTEVDEPAEFDVVMMRHMHHRAPVHCGIALTRGRMLHNEPKVGTIVVDRTHYSVRGRIISYRRHPCRAS